MFVFHLGRSSAIMPTVSFSHGSNSYSMTKDWLSLHPNSSQYLNSYLSTDHHVQSRLPDHPSSTVSSSWYLPNSDPLSHTSTNVQSTLRHISNGKVSNSWVDIPTTLADHSNNTVISSWYLPLSSGSGDISTKNNVQSELLRRTVSVGTKQEKPRCNNSGKVDLSLRLVCFLLVLLIVL